MKAALMLSAAAMAVFATTAAQAQSDNGAPVPQSTPQANSQEGAAVTSTSSNGTAEGGLAEIVVTAQRVAESSQRTPIALDVIEPDELARQNVTRAEDLARVTPALAASSSGGPITNFFVRGVGNNTFNAYSDPAIAFNYDGVYIGRPSSTSGFFYDLQRVELLKGPQGTLYGRNATAGAINVIPNRPELDDTSASFSASFGNYNWRIGQAALNLPLGDKVAVRFSGAFSAHDGFQDDGTGAQDQYGGRAQIYYEPTPDLSLRVSGDYFHQGGTTGSGYYLAAVNPMFGPTGFAGYQIAPTGLSVNSGVDGPQSEALLASRFVSQMGRAGATLSSSPFNDNDYWGVTAELNWKTAAGTLTVQPAYREATLDYQFTGTMRAGYSHEQDGQTSLEARWAGNVGNRIDYLVGGIYFEESIDARASYNQLSLIPFQDFSTRTYSAAGFGKLTVHVTDALSLTAGGRYTSDVKHFDGNADVYIPFCGNPAPPQDFCPTLPFTPPVYTAAALESYYQGLVIPVTPVPLFVIPGTPPGTPFVLRSSLAIDQRLKNDKFTYRLAAQYDLSPRSMVYASFETGYHAGGFSFARGLESYQPETIDAYTIGTKNRFLDNRLQFNLEAFVWKYRNQQYSQFGYDLSTPPTTVLLTRNIGSNTIKGLDLDLDALVTTTTRVSANVQYLDTNYDSFTYFVPNQGLPPITTCGYAPTTQNTSAGVISVYQVDCSGRPAFNSPKWSFNLNGEQTIHLGDADLVLQADTRYRSSSYTSADYPVYGTADANFVTNGSITMQNEADGWFITAFVQNLTDSRRLVGAALNTAASLVVANVEQPRTYGVRFGGKF